MDRTKADFKALRELIGMSQSLLAEELKCNVKSVKRWENPSYEESIPPQEAWEILAKYRQLQEWHVDNALDILSQKEEELESAPACIDLTYWQSADEYEKAHPGEGKYFQMANANSRFVAHELMMEGYDISFKFAGLKATLKQEVEKNAAFNTIKKHKK